MRGMETMDAHVTRSSLSTPPPPTIPLMISWSLMAAMSCL